MDWTRWFVSCSVDKGVDAVVANEVIARDLGDENHKSQVMHDFDACGKSPQLTRVTKAAVGRVPHPVQA